MRHVTYLQIRLALEARCYMIGISGLSLVMSFNLPAYRAAIDAIAGGNLTPSELAINLTWASGERLMYAPPLCLVVSLPRGPPQQLEVGFCGPAWLEHLLPAGAVLLYRCRPGT